jgi:DNA polymerase-3 subunit epsilon
MREIVLDTETTGLSRTDDRVIEIGCVEIENMIPTGRNYHRYINPQREVNKEAFRVHGMSWEMLKAKPVFKRIADRFLEYIGDATLVIHNASFDVGMLNAELARLDLPPLKNPIIDTLKLARDKLPGKRHTLDSLCSHFNIDNSRRQRHGALLDAEILAEVYVELQGGRQIGMALPDVVDLGPEIPVYNARRRPQPLPSRVTDAERLAHREFVAGLGDKAIWLEYHERTEPLIKAA